MSHGGKKNEQLGQTKLVPDEGRGAWWKKDPRAGGAARGRLMGNSWSWARTSGGTGRGERWRHW